MGIGSKVVSERDRDCLTHWDVVFASGEAGGLIVDRPRPPDHYSDLVFGLAH